MALKVYVNINDARWEKYDIDFTKIARAAAGAKYSQAEVSIILTGDTEIHGLNKTYRDMDKATNVLSFELGDDVLMGDIYISLDTVQREAAEANISVAEHTAHMVVHGMLHLQGYDHIQDDEATVMESREIEVLKKLGFKNPYEDVVAGCSDCCPGTKTIAFFERMKKHVFGAWSYALCAVFGGIAAFGFAPFYCWWLTVLGIAGAYWIVSREHGFWRAFLHAAPFGVAYGVAMFWWSLHSIYVVPELAEQFAVWTIPGLIGLGLGGAIIFSLPFAVAAWCARGAARPFVFAGVWTLVLWMREWVLTGFPWNPLANITIGAPILANSMSLWGALGTTFVIAGGIATAVEFIQNRKLRAVFVPVAVFIIMACVGIWAGRQNIVRGGRAPEENTPIIRLVQPAASQSQKMTYNRADALRQAEYNVRNLVALAMQPGTVDLIVFPETTYPFVITDDDMPLSQILGKPVVLGATVYASGQLYNSMVLADVTGQVTDIYSKSHLVPFGEYSPMGIMPSPSNLTPGDGARVLRISAGGTDFVFAPAICYEVIFSDSLMPRGDAAQAIINITNDTWFGNTPGTYQHLDMVRRYAIESGLPIVRANYSGISAFVASDGEIISALPVGQAGVLDGFVWGAHKTPYRLLGRDMWMVIILLIACIGAISISGLRTKD